MEKKGCDEAVRFLVVNCIVFGALGGREIGVHFMSSCQCSHTYCSFQLLLSNTDIYVVNTTRQSYISLFFIFIWISDTSCIS